MDREVDPLAGRDGVRERRRVRLRVPARRARAAEGVDGRERRPGERREQRLPGREGVRPLGDLWKTLQVFGGLPLVSLDLAYDSTSNPISPTFGLRLRTSGPRGPR